MCISVNLFPFVCITTMTCVFVGIAVNMYIPCCVSVCSSVSLTSVPMYIRCSGGWTENAGFGWCAAWLIGGEGCNHHHIVDHC